MSDGATQQNPPRVFISYSHDSPEHADRVLDLASRLRRDGMDARIDRYQPNPPQGWPRWCAEQILAADFTLLVCTRTYRVRFLGLDAYGQGRGVKWEARIIQNVLYYSEVNTGFLPVIFRAEDAGQIPEALRDATQYLVAESRSEDEGYRKLLRTLAGGRAWHSLDVPAPDRQPPPADASVPTDAVWGESEQVAAGLERIQQAQQTHERSSRYRHWALVALVLLALAGLGWLGWQQWETRSAITDPVVLKAQLENQISETFDTKLGTLKQQGAPPKEIDALYRWRERVEGELEETVAFIQTASETERGSLTAAAAKVLEERGVDAALEMLNERLSEAGERHKARSRELAEAALFKAELHQTRLEHNQASEALEQAIDLDHGWWQPHNRLGLLAYELASWKAAERAFRQARLLVTEETDEATVIHNLALLFKTTNRLGEAEPLYRRALAISEASYGPEHPDVALTLSNLAVLLWTTNRLEEAEPLMRRALAINEASYGPEHPDVARDLSILAQLLEDTNRLGEAEPLMRRALAIDAAIYGLPHPKVASDLSHLAGLFKTTNRLGEAEPLLRVALAINEASYGPEHPKVAVDLSNLAVLLWTTNRLEEAEPLMRRALAIYQASYGHEHPNVASALSHLAQLHRTTNRLEEAEPLMRRALAINEASYGPEHPDVALALNNLAGLLQTTKRLEEAEPLIRRALAIYEASYGPEHPDVALALNNLATLLQGTNRLGEAEPLIRRALTIDEASLGHEHPYVARDLNNLATLLQDTSRLSEAEPLMRRALTISETSLGAEHPDVASYLNNLAGLLEDTNRLGEAESLYRRALVILLKSARDTGHPHPTLASMMANYLKLLGAMDPAEEELVRRILTLGAEAGLGAEDLRQLLDGL